MYFSLNLVDEQALRYMKNINLVLSKRVQRDIFSQNSKFHGQDLKRSETAEIAAGVVTIGDNCAEWAKKMEDDFYGWIADRNRDLTQWDEPVHKALSFDKPEEGNFTYYNACISYLKALVTFSKSELLVTLDNDDRKYLDELIADTTKLRRTIAGIYAYCYDISTVHTDIVTHTADALRELYIGLEQLLRVCVESVSTCFSIRRRINNRRFAAQYNASHIKASGGRVIETMDIAAIFRLIFWNGKNKRPDEYPINNILAFANKEIIELRRNVNTVMRRVIGDRHPLLMRFNSIMSSVIQGVGHKKLEQAQLGYLEDTFFDMWAIASAKNILSEKLDNAEE